MSKEGVGVGYYGVLRHGRAKDQCGVARLVRLSLHPNG